MKSSSRQQGFTIIEVLMIVVVVVLIGFVGWLVYNRLNDNAVGTSTTNTNIATEQEVNEAVPAPQSSSDLKKLDSQLNDASLGDTNVTNLNDELNF